MKLRKKWVTGIMLAFILSLGNGSCRLCPRRNPSDTDKTNGTRQQKKVVLATTTALTILDCWSELEPIFKEKTGYEVSHVAVGTGRGLRMGEKGDGRCSLNTTPPAIRAATG